MSSATSVQRLYYPYTNGKALDPFKDCGKRFVRLKPVEYSNGVKDFSHIPANLTQDAVNKAAIKVLGLKHGKFQVEENFLGISQTTVLSSAFLDNNWIEAKNFLGKVKICMTAIL